MKKIILFFFTLSLFADEVYFVDSSKDIDNLGQGGWLFIEDTAFIEKNETVIIEPSYPKKQVDIKIEYINSDTGECKSAKKGCGSSR